MITNDTKVADLTVGELLEFLASRSTPETVSGLKGIAEIFGVSLSTAKRIKASGVIDGAVSQQGRVIVTDVKRARELYAQSCNPDTTTPKNHKIWIR